MARVGMITAHVQNIKYGINKIINTVYFDTFSAPYMCACARSHVCVCVCVCVCACVCVCTVRI